MTEQLRGMSDEEIDRLIHEKVIGESVGHIRTSGYSGCAVCGLEPVLDEDCLCRVVLIPPYTTDHNAVRRAVEVVVAKHGLAIFAENLCDVYWDGNAYDIDDSLEMAVVWYSASARQFCEAVLIAAGIEGENL